MTILRLRFDPDLPLFTANVNGHTVEIYFNGHKGTRCWKLWFDADSWDIADLHEVILKAEELCRQRLGVKAEFYFPVEDE